MADEGILDWLFGGSNEPADSARAARIKQKQQGGEEDVTVAKKYMESLGIPPEEQDFVLNMDEDEQNKYILEAQKQRKSRKYDPAKIKGMVEGLYGEGEERPNLEGLTEEGMYEFYKQETQNRRIRGRQQGRNGRNSATVDPDARKKFKEQMPSEYHDLVDTMNDSQLSQFSKQFAEKMLGMRQPKYREKAGKPKINITIDDDFRKHGYKSGDTVCVKIP